MPLRYSGLWLSAGVLGLLSIFAAALVPAGWLWSSGGGPGMPHADKWLHAFTFAFLGIWFCGQFERQRYVRVAYALFAFGLAIELCQAVTDHRSADFLDLVADVLGIGVGLVFAFIGLGGWSLRLEDWYMQRRAGSQ